MGIHYIQAWPRFVDCGLAVQVQKDRRHRPGIDHMNMNVNSFSTAVSMPVCISIDDTQVATHENAQLWKLKLCLMHGHKKAMN